MLIKEYLSKMEKFKISNINEDKLKIIHFIQIINIKIIVLIVIAIYVKNV